MLCGGAREKNWTIIIHFAFLNPVRSSIRPGSFAVIQHLGPDHPPLRLLSLFQLWLFPPSPTPPRSLSPSLPLFSFHLPPIIPFYTIPSPRTLVTTPIFLKKLLPSFPSSPYPLLQSFPRPPALVLSPYPNRNAQRGSLAARTPVDRLSSFPTKHFGATTNNRSAYRAELTAYYLSGSLNIFFILSRELCVYHGHMCVCVCMCVCMEN